MGGGVKITPDQYDVDEAKFEKVENVDSDRPILVMNTNNWIEKAHGVIDQRNAFDRECLEKIAVYAERIGCVIAAHGFILSPSAERVSKCVVMPKEKIVPRKEDVNILKRGMDFSNDSLPFAHAVKHHLGGPVFNLSENLGIFQPEIVVENGGLVSPLAPHRMTYEGGSEKICQPFITFKLGSR